MIRHAYLLVTLLLSIVALSAHAAPPTGDASIRAKAGPSEIVITTTSRVAGAIHSLTWNGKEFIDSFDHGRQLQSATNFDFGQKFIPETFNPTEAGSMSDGAGKISTSKLLSIEAAGAELKTSSQMAFWLAPGEKSLGHPAINPQRLSNHLLKKHVTIGYQDLPHAIDYRVTFVVPEGERHTFAQFEALTGYMPWEFSRFRTFDPKSGELKGINAGPGEQPLPLVFSTEDDRHAMGIYWPAQPLPGYQPVGYGRWSFKNERVNKWNVVFRLANAKNGAAGEYSFRMFVVVGTLDDVRGTMAKLVAVK